MTTAVQTQTQTQINLLDVDDFHLIEKSLNVATCDIYVDMKKGLQLQQWLEEKGYQLISYGYCSLGMNALVRHHVSIIAEFIGINSFRMDEGIVILPYISHSALSFRLQRVIQQLISGNLGKYSQAHYLTWLAIANNPNHPLHDYAKVQSDSDPLAIVPWRYEESVKGFDSKGIYLRKER